MKKQTLAACIFAAITLSIFSCYWLNKKEKAPAAAQPSVVGKWQVTGISDSGKSKNGFANAFFASFNADSVKAFATFGADSSLTISYSSKQLPDTTKYYIDTAAQNVFIKERTAFDTLAIAKLNDSVISLKEDGIYVELKKLP